MEKKLARHLLYIHYIKGFSICVLIDSYDSVFYARTKDFVTFEYFRTFERLSTAKESLLESYKKGKTFEQLHFEKADFCNYNFRKTVIN